MKKNCNTQQDFSFKECVRDWYLSLSREKIPFYYVPWHKNILTSSVCLCRFSSGLIGSWGHCIELFDPYPHLWWVYQQADLDPGLESVPDKILSWGSRLYLVHQIQRWPRWEVLSFKLSFTRNGGEGDTQVTRWEKTGWARRWMGQVSVMVSRVHQGS